MTGQRASYCSLPEDELVEDSLASYSAGLSNRSFVEALPSAAPRLTASWSGTKPKAVLNSILLFRFFLITSLLTLNKNESFADDNNDERMQETSGIGNH